MKRSPLKRHKPLARSPMRRKPRRRKTTAASQAYMLAVKRLPCCATDYRVPCLGPIEAHHAGRRGLSQKASDLTCIPLCRYHHQSWHDARGVFWGWVKAERREWAEARIAETQSLIAGRVDTATGDVL